MKRNALLFFKCLLSKLLAIHFPNFLSKFLLGALFISWGFLSAQDSTLLSKVEKPREQIDGIDSIRLKIDKPIVDSLKDSTLDSLNSKLDSLLRLHKEAKDDSDKRILFAIGGNLNFLENPKIEGLYYDVSSFFMLGTAEEKKKPKENLANNDFFHRLGIDFRFAQGRFVTSEDSVVIENSQTILGELMGDSIQALTQSYSFKSHETLSYLVLSAAPVFRLSKNPRNPFYFVLHTEFTRRSTIRNISREIISQDTLLVMRNVEDNFRPFPVTTSQRTVKTIEYNQILAPGIYFNYNLKNVNIRVKAVAGPSTISNAALAIRGELDRKTFYLFHFDALYTGSGSFKIGGEIRGFTKEVPSATVYIAKTFSFKTLSSLFK